MQKIKHQLNTCSTAAESARKRELARIHVLAHELGLDREDYEAILTKLTGATSAAGLSGSDRQRVIHELTTRHLEQSTTDRDAPPHNLMAKPMLQKIGALLREAHRPWAYANSLAWRICKRERLEFCADADLHKIVAALMYDQHRRAAQSGRAHA